MRISLKTHLSVKSSSIKSVFVGFSQQPPHIHSSKATSNKCFGLESSLFLLLMDEGLNQVMKVLTLEEDLLVVLSDDEDYSAAIRNGRNLIGRLLNPDVQNMARMLRTMPKIWRTYERVRGIALSKESFQFIFDLETYLDIVMKQGFWTCEDWGMVMDRWMEFPLPDFLQKASVWIRLHKLPVNYLTIKTIRAVSHPIGHVKDNEFDPAKPHLQEYVRVKSHPGPPTTSTRH